MEPKQIVVTGVSRGLGRAMAKGFIAAGHTVHGCARDAAAIEVLGREHSAANTFTVVDVTRDDQVQAWADKVLGNAGPPDLLVNNAAIINRNAPLWELTAEEIAAILAVNVGGVANVIRHFVPAMVERRRGVIVNFSSGWGRSVSAEVAPYCATKFAIEGLTKALAEELPKGMAAVPLNPGIIDTDMLQSTFGSSASSYPSSEEWAQHAVPFILALGPADNGQSLSVEEE
ncbi:MAG TPA: SDR family NAD(P)-dependent oxidoreductase [Pirellulales bacterium]|jgi:NAD(P)-dependent dehydrogenase (short-subunit alcohol dehydrogenase family)|nr:SDR family NAD(P)-dependent oxidoreductase [Pirellulales bacterium]